MHNTKDRQYRKADVDHNFSAANKEPLPAGDYVGSGKYTSFRYAVSRLHPSEYPVFSLVATSGSLLELYRQLRIAMGVESYSCSSAYLTKTLREMLCDIAVNIQIPLLVIGEAHLRLQMSIPKGSVDVNCESPKSCRYICCCYIDYLFSENTPIMFAVTA